MTDVRKPHKYDKVKLPKEWKQLTLTRDKKTKQLRQETETETKAYKDKQVAKKKASKKKHKKSLLKAIVSNKTLP